MEVSVKLMSARLQLLRDINDEMRDESMQTIKWEPSALFIIPDADKAMRLAQQTNWNDMREAVDYHLRMLNATGF